MFKHKKYVFVVAIVVLAWGGITFATGNGTVISPGGSDRDISLEPTGTGKVYVGGDSLVVATKTAAPSPAVTGQIYFDSMLGQFRGYDGTSWLELSNTLPDFPDANLISYWKLDEASGTRVDSHGSNDLTDNNTVLSGTGKIGNAADLERDNSESLSIADGSQSGLDVTGDMSISLWVKPEATPGSGVSYQMVSKSEGTGNQRSYQFLYQDNGAGQRQLRVILSSDGTTNDTDVTKNISDLSTAVLSHIVITVDVSGNITYYVNAVSQGTSASGSASIFNGSADFKIGGQGTEPTNNNTFDGVEDEVGIWNRVLTSDEVADLYNNGSGLAF